MVFKNVIGAIAICMSFSATVAHALPSYEYNAGGDQIIGISSVNVQGSLWDMTLHDGSFDDLYATMGSTAFYADQFAHDASDALFAFTSSDTFSPDLFLGCTSLINCRISTATHFIPTPSGDLVVSWYDSYSNVIPDGVGGGQDFSSDDSDDGTWATWQLSSSTVPEPSIAILMVSGLIAFGVVRRKRRV